MTEPTHEYGIACETDPTIETLGCMSRAEADETVADSLTIWPGVYLVERTNNGPWCRASKEKR